MERRSSKRKNQSFEPYQRRPASSYASRAFENKEKLNIVFSPEKMREKIRSYGLNIVDEKNTIFDWSDEEEQRRKYTQISERFDRDEYVRNYDYSSQDVQRKMEESRFDDGKIGVRERRSSFNMAESLRDRGTLSHSNPLIEKYKYLINSPTDSERMYRSGYTSLENDDRDYSNYQIDSTSPSMDYEESDDLSTNDIEIKGAKIPKYYFRAFPSMNKTSKKRINKTIGIPKDKCLDERENSAFKFIRPRIFPPVPDFAQSALKRPRTDDMASEISTIKKRRLLTNNIPESEKKKRMLHQRNPLSPSLTYDQVLSRKKKIQNRLQNNFKPSLRVKLYDLPTFGNIKQSQVVDNMSVDTPKTPSFNPPVQQKPVTEQKVIQESFDVVELLSSSDDEEVLTSPVPEKQYSFTFVKKSYSSAKNSSDSESESQSPDDRESSEREDIKQNDHDIYSSRSKSPERESSSESESQSPDDRESSESEDIKQKDYDIHHNSSDEESQSLSQEYPDREQSRSDEYSRPVREPHSPQSYYSDSESSERGSPDKEHPVQRISDDSSDEDIIQDNELSYSTSSDKDDSSDRDIMQERESSEGESPDKEHPVQRRSDDSSDEDIIQDNELTHNSSSDKDDSEKEDIMQDEDAMSVEDESIEKSPSVDEEIPRISKFVQGYDYETSSSSDKKVETEVENPLRMLSFGEKDDEVSASSSNMGFGGNKAEDEDIPDAFGLTKTDSDASLYLGKKLTYEKSHTESSEASFSQPQSTYPRPQAMTRALSFTEHDDEISESSSNIVENRYGDEEDLPDAFGLTKTESDATLILKIPTDHTNAMKSEKEESADKIELEDYQSDSKMENISDEEIKTGQPPAEYLMDHSDKEEQEKPSTLQFDSQAQKVQSDPEPAKETSSESSVGFGQKNPLKSSFGSFGSPFGSSFGTSPKFGFGADKNPATPPMSPSQSSPGFGRRTSLTVPIQKPTTSILCTPNKKEEKSDDSEN